MTVKRNYSLRDLNTFGIDCKAAHYRAFNNLSELKESIEWAKKEGLSWRVLGGGSNVLFTGDYPGLILHNQMKGIRFEPTSEAAVHVQVQSGENWHQFVQYCVQNGFGGIENLSLIPGSVGAAPIQNIGAYGVELKDVLETVTFLNTDRMEVVTLKTEECEMGYRDSIFKNELFGKAVVLEITLNLTTRNHRLNTSYGAIAETLKEMGVTNPGIEEISRAVIHIRQSKLPDPSEIGNAGSFFKNPVLPRQQVEKLRQDHPEMPVYPVSKEFTKVPAGWLIEKAGFKGKQVGNTGSHGRQALVIVNRGGATGKEIWDYAQLIMKTVNEQFHIQLKPEVNLVP